jgi:hypothetical protein
LQAQINWANPSPLPGGELVEWLCSGLQIRVHEFDSRTRLQPFQ